MNHATSSGPQSPVRGLVKVASPVLVVAVVGVTLWVNAGDLNPPPGPIQATNRVQLNAQSITLPFTINQRGSYVLTSNLTGVAGQHGIIIQADDVSLDLNGFTLLGVPGSLDGVTVPNGQSNLEIRNGVVRDWGGGGVGAFNAVNSLIADVRAFDNVFDGIRLGLGGIIRDSVARDNGRTGIYTAIGRVVDCAATRNGGDGISANGRSTVTGCSVDDNVGAGIRVTGDSHVVGNTCDRNGSGVWVTSSGNRIEANKVAENAVGINVDFGGNFIARNTAAGNTTQYDFAANNSYGPIVNVVGVGDISGTLDADHAWANFEY